LKLFKVILNVPNLDNSNDIMELGNMLYTEERKILYGLKFVFNHLVNNSDVTPCFEQYFKINDSTNRSNGNIITKYPRSTTGQKSFFFWCPKYWNSLPLEVKKCKRNHQFDLEVRQELKLRKADFVYQVKTF